MTFIEARKRVHELNKMARNRLGAESEKIVDDALNLLVENGAIVTSWIADGNEDREFGIDRHLQLSDGTIIDLQVKSSITGVNEAKRRFPHIPVIEVKNDEDLEQLSKRIQGLIQSKLKGKF